MVSEGEVKMSFCCDKYARQDGRGGRVNRTAALPPIENEIKEKHTDFVETMISMVLRDLAFNKNQSVKSAND